MPENLPHGTSNLFLELDPTQPVSVSFVPISQVRIVLATLDRSVSTHAPGTHPQAAILGMSMQVETALEIFSKIRKLAQTLGWPLPTEDEDQA
jgi:hypothetical protein